MSEWTSDKFLPGDFYWNEQGFRVFTKQYHLRRGYCCNNSCKHCPYKKKEKTTSNK